MELWLDQYQTIGVVLILTITISDPSSAITALVAAAGEFLATVLVLVTAPFV